MNEENTNRIENERKQANENIMNIHNMDMSQEAPMIPVYMPIIEEYHGVMFMNSSKSLNEECFRHVLIDMDKQGDEIMIHDTNDSETFAYRDKMAGSNTPMVEAVYFDAQKVKKVLFNGDTI